MSDAHGAMTPRRPRPELRLDVWGAVAVTLLAWVAYLATRQIDVAPARGYGVVLFAVATTCAAAAAVVLWGRARGERDPALGWVAAGVTVSFVAMVLQLISSPAVSPGGGPLGTHRDGGALLYLLFHWSLLLGAVAGAARVPLRARPVALACGVIVALLVAGNRAPVGPLLHPDYRYTALLLRFEQVTAVTAILAMGLWMVRSGRRAPALHGWIAVALAFNTYDIVLNALAGQRYDPVWWASASMRLATFAVPAVAATVTVLVQLRRHEQYADAELSRREGELRAALRAQSELLASAEALTGAVSEAEVARVAAAAAMAATD